MNREKKQFAVIGALVALILGVGAFQITRKDAPAPPPATKKEAAKPAADKADKPAGPKYPELLALPEKDPFEIATFVSVGSKAATTPPVTPTTPKVVSTGPGGTSISGAGRRAMKRLDGNDPGIDGTLPSSGPTGPAGLKPLQPEEPVFGYTCIGIVEGAHPMAVFDDGKGNQQLVEAGQGIGPSATITHISRGTVRVKFNAKTLTFNVGGNPTAK